MKQGAVKDRSARRGLMPDPRQSAQEADLRYVDDDQPGICRKKWGRGFTYIDRDGNHITDEERRERLEELAIPPAWTDVWICPYENGHLQATGRDDEGRKQYLYHPNWKEVRRRARFRRLIPFGEALPQIRQRCVADLGRDGLPREKILAVAVRILDQTLIRIGNNQSARKNGAYGLTTLQDWHVACSRDHCSFRYTGKSGQEHEIELDEETLVEAVRRCCDIPGSDLFQYYNDDGRYTIEAKSVNSYLKEAADRPVTAKDFRTWGGTLEAALALTRTGPFESEEEARRNISRMFEQVADRLDNTKAVCREHYIDPGLVDLYREERLLPQWKKRLSAEPDPYLGTEEHALLEILRGLHA